LLALKEQTPGYKVFTADDLKAKGFPGSARGEIYAIFEVTPDPVFNGQKWDGRKLQEVMTQFEARRNYRKMKALKSLSALPRVLSLRELLKVML
jgi:hypothetical protein